MKRLVCICLIALASLIFASACDDHIEVQQNYDFALGTWHLPEDIPGVSGIPDSLFQTVSYSMAWKIHLSVHPASHC